MDIGSTRVQLRHERGIYVDTGFHPHFYVACSASPEPCGERISGYLDLSRDVLT